MARETKKQREERELLETNNRKAQFVSEYSQKLNEMLFQALTFSSQFRVDVLSLSQEFEFVYTTSDNYTFVCTLPKSLSEYDWKAEQNVEYLEESFLNLKRAREEELRRYNKVKELRERLSTNFTAEELALLNVGK